VSGSALDNNGNPLTDASGRSYTCYFETRMVQADSPAEERLPSSTILSGDASRSLGRWEGPITSTMESLAEQSPVLEELFDPFFQGYGHCVTLGLPDRLANVCPYRQFMCAVTQSHERTPKGVPIDFAPDLYQAASSKELD
jgi:hypothetical protein